MQIVHFPFITIMLLVPLVGAAFILTFIKSHHKAIAQNLFAMGLWISLINLFIGVVLLGNYDVVSGGLQFVEEHHWIASYNIKYKVGVDGLSIFFILLTAVLTPLCLLISKYSATHRLKEYIVLFLLLESFIIGAFAAVDLVIFYLFFELTLIPMFLIIGIFGGEERIYATFKFFLYTFAGSIIFLVAIIYILNVAHSADAAELSVILPELLNNSEAHYLWFAFFLAFAIKIPMWPLHTWLPDAHVQAPTAGSVILAGVLIKLGAYAMIRFLLPFFPEATQTFQPMVLTLGVIAIIYTSMVALMQEDMKKLIAYSSVAHMGYVVIGIFAFNDYSLNGAVIQMISHGIISAALFIHVGIIYDKLHSKQIADINALATRMPKFSLLFVIFVLGSVALPGTSGFVGEFLVLLGLYQEAKLFAILAALGVVIGAIYMLWLTKRTIMGEANAGALAITDINAVQLFVLGLLAVLVLLLGIYPQIVINIINVSLEPITALYL